MKRCLAVFAMLAVCLSGRAQQLLWSVAFDTRFDNREYSGSRLETSQTLFSTRLSPEAGIGWGKGNAVMAGADLRLDHGAARQFDTAPEAVIYYRYDSPLWHATAGVFPRRRIAGSYSTAFFSDSVRFFDNNIEGLLLQYTGRRGYAELGLDWDGMYSVGRRESFRIFSAARLQRRWFYAGYAFSMYHLAGAVGVWGVVDNILVNPYVGFDFTGVVPVDKFSLQAGWLQSMQRDRINENKFLMPGGAVLDLLIENWGVGLHNMAYIGGGQMPLYDRYGTRLYAGEQFFATSSGVYNRTELYWNISPRTVRRLGIDLHVGVAAHWADYVLGWQQTAHLSILLDGSMFRRRRK